MRHVWESTPSLFGEGRGYGCNCASCAYTAPFYTRGFAEWPRGKPAGRSAARDYAAHVKHGLNGIQRAIPEGYADRPFYTVPAGMTRKQVAAATARTFACGIVPTAFDTEES